MKTIEGFERLMAVVERIRRNWADVFPTTRQLPAEQGGLIVAQTVLTGLVRKSLQKGANDFEVPPNVLDIVSDLPKAPGF